MTWIGDIPFKELGMDQERLALLKELAEDNDYWRKASSFFHQVVDRKLSSLSVSQHNWLETIIASLGVELDRRAAREVFNDS